LREVQPGPGGDAAAPPTAGRVILDGVDLAGLSDRDLRPLRPRFQVIFQDPSPRSTRATGWLRSWASRRPSAAASGAALDQLVDETLEAVGLDPASTRNRRPTQFSGGQCQRICIARALVLSPELLICDEPVSALDVSVQAQILNLLEELRSARRLTLLFISHDLAVVKNISDRVAVMYLGKICEVGSPDALYRTPAHPYTEALIEAIPDPDPAVRRRRLSLVGELPSAADPPSGCRFRTRCPRAEERCRWRSRWCGPSAPALRGLPLPQKAPGATSA